MAKVVVSIDLPEKTQNAILALWRLTKEVRERIARGGEELATFTSDEVSKYFRYACEGETEKWLRNAEKAGIIERWERDKGYPEFFFDDCVEILDYSD